HRHRFEFNNQYRRQLADAGMIFAGVSPDARLVEVVELGEHPFMVGCQFHPEFKSRPNKPHPLFQGFIQAAIAHQSESAAQPKSTPTGLASSALTEHSVTESE
ncbi:MAG: hypothetical protein KDD78_18735, partial [Caldilineaceae bacterium]|nr:hypothetical protein [Caldilineaceae bacterium]